MLSKPKILFLGGGTRCTHFEYFKGYFEVHCTDTDDLAPSEHVIDFSHDTAPFESPEFIEDLMRIVKYEDINVVAPASHHSIIALDNMYKYLDELGTRILLSRIRATDCLSKKITASLFHQEGILTPYVYWDSYNASKIEYPVMIRPIYGSGSKNCFVARSEQEFAFFVEYIPGFVFVQEYIEGDEYTVDIFSDFEANPICIVPRKRIEVRDGEVVKAVTVYDEKLIEQCKMIAKNLGLVGMSCIQCIERDGEYYFIEINPRFAGGVTLSIHARANIPLYLSRIMAGEKLEYSKDWQEGVYMSRAYRDFYSDTPYRKPESMSIPASKERSLQVEDLNMVREFGSFNWRFSSD